MLFGGYLEVVWKLFGSYLEVVYRYYLEAIWWSTWRLFGCYLDGGWCYIYLDVVF